MSDLSTSLKDADLAGLVADGLREAKVPLPSSWEPPTPEDLKGVLPRHEIVRLIGRGGMGAVYEAQQSDLDRRVAVKILPVELSADEAFAERFRREAQMLGRLRHPNILEVYEFGESTAGHLYFTMEYVESGDLGVRLQRGPLGGHEVFRMVKEICAALEAAHALGVIHRDIKPGNILLTADGTVKVADFGIAMREDQPQERLTFTGLAVGTMAYAAPEQAAGKPTDARSDLYSVGVLFYELLTGTLPRGVFDPPSKVNGDLAPAVDNVVRTAMQNDPQRRYQSATDLRTALHRSSTALPRKTRGTLLTAFVVLAVLAVSAGLFHWWPGRATVARHATDASQPVAPVAGSTIVAWGKDDYGECSAPPNLGKVQAIGAGDGFTVALKSDGTVAAWGRNDFGQTSVPPGLAGVRAIAAGGYHILALKSDGTIVAWGTNRVGQTTVPAGLSDVQAIAAGNAFSIALKRDGTLVAWGDNEAGQASPPAGLTGVTAISAGGASALALKTDGTVVCWGDSADDKIKVPDGLAGVRNVAAGWLHCLALKNNGAVVAWGSNDQGQTDVPAGLTGVQAISAGLRHNLALKSDGTVIAWGIVGNDTWGDRAGQTEVPAGLVGVKAIAAGFRHSVALK